MKLNKKYVFFGMISLVIILSVIFFIGNSKVLINEDYTLPEKIKNIKLISAIDIDIFNKNKGYSTSPSFERKVLIQTEVDENFPCYVQNGDTIVCKAINESKKEKYLSTLSPVDASLLDSGSVPITNIEGSVIRERNINWNRDTEIKIDLTSQSGKFIIGFGSNEFILTTLSNGVFNLTHESGGDIYLDASELTGSYFTELIDLNKTQSVVNISFESTQPSGTDIGVLVRTHNLTNGSDLSYDLQRYWKLDAPTGTSVFDYSGNNDTGTFAGTPTPTSEGKFDNAIVFDSKYDYIDIDSDIFDYVERTTPYTISLWFKANTLDRGRLISITHNYGERHVMNIYSNELMTCLYDGSFHCKSIAFTDTTNWHNIIMIHDGSQGITAYLDGSEMTGTTAEGTAGGTYSRIGSDGTYGFNGIIDEVAIWNRTLSSAEVTQLYSMGQVGAWSDWTSRFTSSPSSFTVDDGRYVQVKSEIERPGGENVYLESITIGYTDVGAAPTPDNPPETFLNTTDAITFTEPEANLSCAGHDDFDIVNISIYTDANGTWLLNQTESFSGIQTKAEASFNISGISDGTYNWSCLSCDNASSTQCDMADNNRTFTISTSCIDEECYPYLCNDVTQTCRTSCTSHSHVNASSYCASDGTAKPAEPDLSDCANKEWSSLTDDEVCIDQSSGYCYDDNIGATGEYCVDVSTECVNDGTSYSEGEFICGFGDGNDHYQCLGGESAWSGLTDCIDLGDPYDASATVSGHTYCGYYEASTCSALTGCSTPTTQDCGNYYYDGSSCGTAKEDCDTGCGAAYDLDTCNEEVGYTLSEDCSTCTPPTTDVPPIVSLTSPDDDSISSSLEVTFGYTVAEDWNIRNCTFWHNASGSYHLNQTNTTEIAFDGSTINYFTQTFKDNQFPSWTIYCCDNATTPQCDWGSNRTVIIQTTYVGERKFRFFNESYGNEVFSISQHGDVNISTGELSVTNDAYIYGTLRGDNNGLDIDKLVISDYLDINGAGTSRIRLSNPYNEYLKLTGETGIGSLLIGLFNKNPYISTETGDYIEFGNDLRVGGDIRTTTLNVTGNAHITNINPDGNALYIGGEYEDGGVTIQYGNIFAQNFTLNGSLISSGTIQTGGSIIPNATDVYDIGEVDTIWRYGFFRGLNVSDEVYINDVPVSPWLYNMSLSPTITPWLYNQTSSSGWRKSGTNVFLDTLTDSVGIGTDSPTAVLDVKGNLNVSGGINITSGDLTLIDGGLNVSGNIGIGRNSYDLDVWRDTGDAVLRLRSGTGEDAAIQLQTPAANQDYKIYVDEDDSQSLKIDRWHDGAWNNKITLTTGDKFALGTTKPQYQFQIESASPYIYINDTTSSNYATLIGQINDIFSINRIGSGGNDIQIQADGDIILAGTTGDYIGIGTDSPTHTLTVSGDVNISGNLTSRMASFGKGVPQKWFLINSSYNAGDFKGAAVKGSAGSNTFGALAYCAGGTPPTVYGVYGKNGTISQQKYAGYFDGHIYVDGELISGSACGVPSGTFSAEESGGLDATSYEWSFGSGVALDDAGIVQPCQGVITAMSVQCDSCIGTTSTVEVQINNAGTSCETDIDTAGGGGGTYGFDSSCTDSFSAGDNLNFYTIDDDGACTSCVATMWVRYR